MSHTIKASLLHHRFETYLASVSANSALLDEAERRVRALWTLRTEARTEVRGLLARIKALDERRLRLCETREDGTYTAAEFKERLVRVLAH